jgi:hypothetical protein
MNQMGHKAPNLIGVRTGDLNQRVNTFLGGYMTMGETGMAGMGDMGMRVPRNSLPMVGMQGKHDYIDMGGMFTVVKICENLTSYDDPGWYENPPGTLASLASNDELQRDLGQILAADAIGFAGPGLAVPHRHCGAQRARGVVRFAGRNWGDSETGSFL